MNVKAINNISFDIFRSLCLEKRGQNSLCSPLSIASVLNSLMVGADNETEAQLFRGFRYHRLFEGSHEVHGAFEKELDLTESLPCPLVAANLVLVNKDEDNPVTESFRIKLRSTYNSMVNEVNYETEKVIDFCNTWIKTETRGNITDIGVNKFEEDSKLTVVCAVHLRGDRFGSFDPELTRLHKFYNHGNEEEVKLIPMMYQKSAFNYSLTVIKGSEVQILELPYNSRRPNEDEDEEYPEDLSMFIILPTKESTLSNLVKSITLHDFEKETRLMSQIDINVYLPLFNLESKSSLNGLFTRMGIKEPFSVGADFAKIRPSGDLRLSQVLHCVSMDFGEQEKEDEDEDEEESLQPKAAVGGELFKWLTMSRKKELRAERPFLFLVRDNRSGVIIFVGKIEKFLDDY